MFNTLLSSGTTAGTGGIGQYLSSGLLIVGFIALFYFFILRPQKKQEKQVAAMHSSLAVGDEITTIGGIVGEVVSIKEETLLIETSRDRTRIRILKSAVKNIDVKADEK